MIIQSKETIDIYWISSLHTRQKCQRCELPHD